MSSEAYSYIYEKLLKEGALDVYATSIFMKKNRPAYKLSVICREEDLEAMSETILKETTSIGVRYHKVDRRILERKVVKIKTRYGNVRVKLIYDGGKLLRHTPEYDDCREIAEHFDIPFLKVYEDIKMKMQKYFM